MRNGICIFWTLMSCVGFITSSAQFEYSSPINGSKYHKCETQIFFRPGGKINEADFTEFKQTKIIGSKSGVHEFGIKLLENKSTILIIPNTKFEYGESVSVEFAKPFDTLIEFEIESKMSADLFPLEWHLSEEIFISEKAKTNPPSFPEAIVTQIGETGPGAIYGSTSANMYDIFILDDLGVPLYKENLGTTTAQNFRYLNDSLCVFASVVDQFYLGLDTAFQVVDTFRAVNGYDTDFHEILMTETGNIILMSFDQQVIDMSQIVPGGQEQATVTGLVIQEIDPNDNLVFQWRSWDHYEITDALYAGTDSIDFTSEIIPYVHGNSVDIGPDGNWVISSRHLSEITNISRTNGEIIWRLGGRNNEFTFVDDPLNGFNLQHDARWTTNGTLTIFDNGFFHSPQQTRVLEYEIDEINNTATLIWEFPNPYGDVTQVAGNAQRLLNGNTFISWGRRTTIPIPNDFFLEVDQDGNIVFEMGFVEPTQMGWIYRAYRLPFKRDTLLTHDNLRVESNHSVSLFPNPTKDALNLNFGIDRSGTFEIKVFDAAGKSYYSNPVFINNEEEIQKIIPTRELDNGVYFLTISNKGGVKITKRFIKIK